MSLRRYAAKRDKNETEIVEVLRASGATVLPLSGDGIPDLAVYFRSKWHMLEVKTAKGKLRPAQDWHESISPDAVHIVRTWQEALDAIGGR